MVQIPKNRCGVEDQGHAPVAEDRGAGDAGDVGEVVAERLDHGLPGAEELIDDETGARAVVLYDQDVLAGGRGGRTLCAPTDANAALTGRGAQRAPSTVHPEQLPHSHVRYDLVAKEQHARRLLARLVGGELDAFDDALHRHDPRLFAGSDAEAFDDREREWEADGERRADAFTRLDGDRAAQRFDAAPHDVHPHAPAGEVGNLLRRREARLEDDAVVGADGSAVEPRAVVGDADGDRPGLVLGRQGDVADGRLSLGYALARRLDAVIDGVADHVRNGIAQELDGGGVDLDVVADRAEARVLAVDRGGVAHRARVLPEHRPDRHHPRAHDQLLQLGLELVDLALDFDEGVDLAHAQHLPHPPPRDGDLAGQVEHAVQLLGADADVLHHGWDGDLVLVALQQPAEGVDAAQQ